MNMKWGTRSGKELRLSRLESSSLASALQLRGQEVDLKYSYKGKPQRGRCNLTRLWLLGVTPWLCDCVRNGDYILLLMAKETSCEIRMLGNLL